MSRLTNKVYADNLLHVEPPSPPPPPHTQSMYHELPPQTSPSTEPPEPISSPLFRATSEPPPDTMEEESNLPSSSKPPLKIQPPQQEYSWEWGAFPQPSPMKASFGKGGRINGGGGGPLLNGKLGWEAKSMRMNKSRRLDGMHLPELQHNEHNLQEEEEKEEEDYEFSYLRDRVRDRGRSQSVPPELQGSPTSRKQKRDSKGWKEYEDFESSSPSPEEGAREYGEEDYNGAREAEFGVGGLLVVRKDDPTKFILKIEGRRMAFQLSLVPGESATEDAVEDDEDEGRGRKIRDGSRAGGLRVLPSNKRGQQDEVEATRLFEQGLVSFDQFLNDESILSHPRLVIRWAGVEQSVLVQPTLLHSTYLRSQICDTQRWIAVDGRPCTLATSHLARAQY